MTEDLWVLALVFLLMLDIVVSTVVVWGLEKKTRQNQQLIDDLKRFIKNTENVE